MSPRVFPGTARKCASCGCLRRRAQSKDGCRGPASRGAARPVAKYCVPYNGVQLHCTRSYSVQYSMSTALARGRRSEALPSRNACSRSNDARAAADAAPVWRGGIQAPGLGMAVDVWSDDGNPVRGEKGELVCTKPFPSMPVRFWNDPEGRKYHAAYFERFPNVWCHGDFAEWTAHDGIIIHGRSDATLNPGGVRIGTAEIYAQVEQIPEVLEAVAVGQDWENDVRVVLFVRLADGVALEDGLRDTIRKKIRSGATPRHVPAKVVQIADIPRTKSGKVTELAIRDAIHGRPVNNAEALANPEALDLYRDLPELDRKSTRLNSS